MPTAPDAAAPRWSRATAVLASLAGLILLAVAARYGYARIFSVWAAYDDEGYVLQSVRSFLDGRRLYDEVYSQYGPAYFLLQAAIYRLAGLIPSHDAVRLITLTWWIGTAVAGAAIVAHLTRSAVLALIAFVHVVLHLAPLISEAGHPQALLGLVFTLTCLLIAIGGERISARTALGCGLLTGIAALTKINVGAYLFLGVALPLVCAMPLGRFAAPAAVVVAGMVPLLVYRPHLAGRSMTFGVVSALAAVAVVAACWRLYRPPFVQRNIFVAYIGGAAGAAAAVAVIIMMCGTSPGALVASVVIDPVRLAGLFYMPVRIPPSAGVAALGAIALCVILTGRAGRRLPVMFGAKLLFAIGTLYATRVGYESLLAYAPPFAWIILLPVRDTEPARARLGRGVLAATAVFQTFQSYPVGGTQVTFATLLLPLTAFVALHDAMRALTQLGLRHRLAPAALAAAAVVWASLFYRPLFGPEVQRHYVDGYWSRRELRLPGADRVRLLPEEVARLHWLTGTLAANCRTFVSLPGFNSVYAWTGLTPPTAKNAGTWMSLLTPGDQAAMWAALDASPAPCGVLNVAVARNWLMEPVESYPAYDELRRRFERRAELDGFELLLPRGARAEPIVQIVARRQVFDSSRTPLPVAAPLLLGSSLTISTWIRTERNGAILGCQTGVPEAARPARVGLVIYVGTNGTIHAQHPAGAAPPLTAEPAVNDGRWHHVALLRDAGRQSLYVDGNLAGSGPAAAADNTPLVCQAGTAYASSLPQARLGWMGYRGEIDGLRVSPRAWTAGEVREAFERGKIDR